MEAYYGRWKIDALVVMAAAKQLFDMAQFFGRVGPYLKNLTIELLDEKPFIGEYFWGRGI